MVPDRDVKDRGLTSITNLIVRRRYGAGRTIALNAHGDLPVYRPCTCATAGDFLETSGNGCFTTI